MVALCGVGGLVGCFRWGGFDFPEFLDALFPKLAAMVDWLTGY
jgi:hypothetical protein